MIRENMNVRVNRIMRYPMAASNVRRTEDMGKFLPESHGSRSSGMNFAMRWKHENVRLVLLSAILSIAMTFLLLVLLYGTADKQVSVVVDGEERIVTTKQWVLEKLLDELDIEVGPNDELSKPLNAAIRDGDRIVINLAVPVTVVADGEAVTVWPTRRTVEAALEEAGVEVRGGDKVYPSPDAELLPNMTVEVVRVDKQIVQTEEVIPYKVVKKDDPNLEQGKEKIIRPGKEGVIIHLVEKTYENGVYVDSRVLTKTVSAEKQDQIVAVGTKKPQSKAAVLSASETAKKITRDGVTFKAKKVLKNVTLTAYSAGFESTGKTEDHPQYGITASGTRVKEGRTIAVDPNVIPLGWWVYIEGIGFRRAEDKGSAIKGKKIDIYYDSEAKAERFGKKKGYTVYVIGPSKPTAS
jgi:uncharacterized protein YabE (DUF348 family)/3D (Asp-Asp-Asp) domain-containing protein